jgi:hypothetical protein
MILCYIILYYINYIIIDIDIIELCPRDFLYKAALTQKREED